MVKIGGVDQGSLQGLGNSVAPAPVKLKSSDSAKPKVSYEEDGPSQQQAPELLKQSVEVLNDTMKTYNTELRFEFHEKSGEFIVKVLNESDGSVIREIPPEKVLDMVAHFKEMLGFIVNKLI